MNSTYRRRLLALSLLVIVFTESLAQTSQDFWSPRRTFAFESVVAPSLYDDMGSKEWGLRYGFTGELAFTETPWALRLGYLHERFRFGGSSTSLDMDTLEGGVRYYFGKPTSFFQPYAGLSAGWIFSHDYQGYTDGCHPSYNTTFDRMSKPWMSLTPTIGADFYLLSGVSLGVGYSYRKHLGATYSLHNHYSGTVQSYSAMGSHEIQLGLKFVFPRRESRNDGTAAWFIFDTIVDTILNAFY